MHCWCCVRLGNVSEGQLPGSPRSCSSTACLAGCPWQHLEEVGAEEAEVCCTERKVKQVYEIEEDLTQLKPVNGVGGAPGHIRGQAMAEDRMGRGSRRND